MKLTWLTFVRSEEYDPLGLVSFNIFLHYHLLWGLFQLFLLLGRVIVSKWGFKLNTKIQVFAPHSTQLGCTYKSTYCLFSLLVVGPTWVIYLFYLTITYFSYYLWIPRDSHTFLFNFYLLSVFSANKLDKLFPTR